MEMLSGAEMVVRALEDEGISHIFGYPGGSVLDIYDALFENSKIEHVLVRHEQAAIHMADGYARSTGKVGTALVLVLFELADLGPVILGKAALDELTHGKGWRLWGAGADSDLAVFHFGLFRTGPALSGFFGGLRGRNRSPLPIGVFDLGVPVGPVFGAAIEHAGHDYLPPVRTAWRASAWLM